MKKISQQTKAEKGLFNLIKIKKYTANIIVNGEILKTFSSNSDFSSVLETLANSVKQKYRKYKDWKELNKTMIIHI